MIDISSTYIKELIVHQVGNKLRDEGFLLSKNVTELTETLDNSLLKHYLVPLIRQGSEYNFYHESDIQLNTVFYFSKKIFSNNSNFVNKSQDIAKHLYSSSTHPNIGGGEFIIILFEDIRVEGEKKQGLGLFRIEGKNNYLDVKNNNGSLCVIEKMGISLDKIQKGAIIISETQKVYIIDSMSKKTKYWLDIFLKVVPSKTPKNQAKAVGDFIKAVSDSITPPKEIIEFSKQIQDHLLEDSISFNEIKALSSNYINDNEMVGIIAGINSKSGFQLENDSTIESKQLAKLTKEIISKIRIAKGINLVISDKKANVSSMNIQKTKDSIRAIIDIELKGK